jgi:tRNA threonylcarbamoyladenosine biosynthesis protein TsaE
MTHSFVWEKPTVVCDVRESEWGGFLTEWLPAMKKAQYIALIGDMGCGKTTFARSVVEALGGDISLVGSPTFSLKNKYVTADMDVHHLDLYRMPDTPEEHGQLFSDLEETDGLVLIEWADRFSSVLALSGMAIRFYFIDLSVRRVHVYI